MAMEPKYLSEEVIIHPKSSVDKVIGSLGIYIFVHPVLLHTQIVALPFLF